jgi:4-aminobutyrate aminotransferase-like enzyme
LTEEWEKDNDLLIKWLKRRDHPLQHPSGRGCQVPDYQGKTNLDFLLGSHIMPFVL